MIVVKNVIKNEADTLQVTFLRSSSKRNYISYQLSFTFQCDVIYQVQFSSHNKLTRKTASRKDYFSSLPRKRIFFRSSHRRCFANLTGKRLYWGLFLIKLQAPMQVFPCQIWEIFKSMHFEEHLRTNASKAVKHLWWSFFYR